MDLLVWRNLRKPSGWPTSENRGAEEFRNERQTLINGMESKGGRGGERDFDWGFAGEAVRREISNGAAAGGDKGSAARGAVRPARGQYGHRRAGSACTGNARCISTVVGGAARAPTRGAPGPARYEQRAGGTGGVIRACAGYGGYSAAALYGGRRNKKQRRTVARAKRDVYCFLGLERGGGERNARSSQKQGGSRASWLAGKIGGSAVGATGREKPNGDR
ncbi:hypothetical protein B0H17DRAFT_1180056 [Mycena rosella]|uniref:Uncharacterized protein n=1 Tax=Mycena rosella TaxID=1033263 RepID=A0AAD7DES0_MYCRO|nr:hypothetical protein B0H17DRAFT_1180056 [Mycena rosella]